MLQPWNVQCTDGKERDHAESGYNSPPLFLVGMMPHKPGVIVGESVSAVEARRMLGTPDMDIRRQ